MEAAGKKLAADKRESANRVARRFYIFKRNQESSLPSGSEPRSPVIVPWINPEYGVLRGGERLGERASVHVGAKRQGFDNFSPMTSGDEKLPRNPFFAPSGSHLFPIYHPSSSLTTAPPSFTTLDTLTFVVPRL